MKRTAYIWRKSIYDNDFRCNKCGTKLFDPEKGELIEGSASPFFGLREVFCVKCKNHVAHIEEIEYDGEKTLLGRWNGDYKK